jgi:hypothetical protein
VIFVTPKGSPLHVGDAIDEAARVSVLPSARGLSLSAPSWESVVDSTWTLYGQVIGGDVHPARGRGAGQRIDLAAARVGGGRRWR